MPAVLRRASALVLASALLSCGNPATATEPKAPASPAEIVAYHDSGQWDRDTTAVVGRARGYLASRLRAGVRRPVLVLDVDDTSLSNYRCLKPNGFDRAGTACADPGRLPAIRQTLALFRYARARGVAVVFLTGRREALRGATAANLRRAGYGGRWRLMMRPDREPPERHDGFKARRRRAIERGGRRIVVNLGDQRSDLDGGHAMRAYKLPNPMYVIPGA